MIKVIIYSTSNCGMCVAAKNFMDKEGIEYEEVNLSENKAAMKEMMKKGIMTVPFIKIGEQEISGYNPGAILKAINEKRA